MYDPEHKNFDVDNSDEIQGVSSPEVVHESFTYISRPVKCRTMRRDLSIIKQEPPFGPV